jgi:predicted TIM-barrel fold metal-dependent hydrolase
MTPDMDSKKVLSIVSTAMLVLAAALVAWAILGRTGAVTGPTQVVQAASSDPAVLGIFMSPRKKGAYLEKDDPSEKVDSLGPRKWKIIDMHEHVQHEEDAARLIEAMDKTGVQRTCILAATIYTFTLDKKYGFEGFKQNNEDILKYKAKWPDRFCAMITFDPLEENVLAQVKDYVARGADGVKLFLGHGESTGKGKFHVMPLDDPRMEPFWQYAEETQLPIVMHINLNKFWDETVRLMERHPYLRMSIPHFGLHKNSAEKLARLSWLLRRYPNLYTDISFGHHSFQQEGFEALSAWRTRSNKWLVDHADKVMYASDMVLEPTKNEKYIEATLRSYMQWIERERFRFFYIKDRTMHGLNLGDAALTQIYEKTPAHFLLLNEKGDLPDRTKGWPVAGTPVPPRPPLPPFDPASVPGSKGTNPLAPAPSGASAAPVEDDEDHKD